MPLSIRRSELLDRQDKGIKIKEGFFLLKKSFKEERL